METCVEEKVPIIITSLRPPQKLSTQRIAMVGWSIMMSLTCAMPVKQQRRCRWLIFVAAGTGGHAGTLSPFAIVREVKKWFDGTIPAGAIGDGFV